MSETFRQQRSNEPSEIYAQLNKQDVEQFYADYQYWYLQQQAAALQEQIDSLHQQIAENTELLQLVHPPAIAFAAMARLQASGVHDIGLLDSMLERGEDWLDRTMQRLDYCEQLDFIIDDYTQWCQNALEGAYDWIDSMREGGPLSSEVPGNDTSIDTTEELLLQKLTSEDEEQVSQVSQLSQLVETSPAPEPPDTPVEAPPASDSSTKQTDQSEPSTGATDSASESEQLISQVYIEFDPAPEELPSVEGNDDSNVEQLPLQEHSEDGLATARPVLTIEEFPTYREEFLPDRGYQPDKQPGIEADGFEEAEQGIQLARTEQSRNFLQRLVGKIWGS